jgi:repressor LexA
MDFVDEMLAALEKPGKSRTGLARALGRTSSVVTHILSRQRRVQLVELEIIRRYLELEAVCEVIGYVTDNGTDEIIRKIEGIRETVAAPHGTKNLVAVEVIGLSLGLGLVGTFVFYDPAQHAPVAHNMGRLSACGLADGRALMKVPQAGARPGRYLLLPNGLGEIVREAEVIWMSPVEYIARRILNGTPQNS